ncbi:MAG: hypothetical protein ABR968_11290 [Bacteroidales bacterium]
MMYKHGIKYLTFIFALILLLARQSYGGPPFNTDDPEPVQFKHWEYYISTMNIFQQGAWSGTSPHLEMNYGLLPNVQVHLLLPMNYVYTKQNDNINFGYSYTEFGIKYRFMQETKTSPQIGTFPIIEIPTISNNKFGNGESKVFIPVWLQKTWGNLTTYGGGGYWINPGINNKNWIFSGWEIQYDISSVITLGGELYYHSSDAVGNKSVAAINTGGFINVTKRFHIIFSVGHSLINESFTSTYAGLLWTV